MASTTGFIYRADHGGGLGGHLEERSGLGVNAFVVILAADHPARGEQLGQFAVDDGCQCLGKEFHQEQVIGLGSQFGGAGKHVISGQDGGGGRPVCIQGGHAPAEQGPVDQVVVDQGGGVEHLDCRRQGEQFIVGRAEHLAGQQADRRADALPAGGEQMLQRGAQVRMGIIGLGMQERFDFLETHLDGCKKWGCIQAVSFQAKSLPAFSLVTAATSSRLHEWSKAILSAIRRT